MTALPRCEPPPELADREWHWLCLANEPHGQPFVCLWLAASKKWGDYEDMTPGAAYEEGFRYVGPALTPDEVAAAVLNARNHAQAPAVSLCKVDRSAVLQAVADAPLDTYVAIGSRLGISGERVRQIVETSGASKPRAKRTRRAPTTGGNP